MRRWHMDDYAKGSKEWGSKARKWDGRICRNRLKEIDRAYDIDRDDISQRERDAYGPCEYHATCEVCGADQR